mmetsp:Transcript_15938/g.39150  ORF Transcript_15938/g.39150 Transcript_15938/m.39150 type:complete len:225 (-) Transcript_15938:70-744(-)
MLSDVENTEADSGQIVITIPAVLGILEKGEDVLTPLSQAGHGRGRLDLATGASAERERYIHGIHPRAVFVTIGEDVHEVGPIFRDRREVFVGKCHRQGLIVLCIGLRLLLRPSRLQPRPDFDTHRLEVGEELAETSPILQVRLFVLFFPVLLIGVDALRPAIEWVFFVLRFVAVVAVVVLIVVLVLIVFAHLAPSGSSTRCFFDREPPWPEGCCFLLTPAILPP